MLTEAIREGLNGGWVLRVADRLPRRFVARARALALSFADGIVWPAETWRGGAVVGASLVIKLIAASHLFWAGLAFGVRLEPFAYLVLLAILGFIVGAVFALGLFDVEEERAVAMVTVVFTSSMLAVGVAGAFTLWRHGIALGELTTRRVPSDGPA